MVGVKLTINSPNLIGCELLHLGVDVAMEIYFLRHRFEELLELLVAHLVALLELTIIVSLLLHGVIGEVNHLVGEVLYGELKRGCTDVAFLVPVC
jgi:hypothetical protein